MKAPKIYVVSRPSIDFTELSRFLEDEGLSWRRSAERPADSLVEFAGRVCYMSFGKRQSKRSNAEYVANLIRQGHESVLEHASWTFLLSGVSRAFTHQLVRHRPGWSFSQLSQQYHDERQSSVITPRQMGSDPEMLMEWQEIIGRCHDFYAKIIERLSSSVGTGDLDQREALRRIRSAARSVLPESTETKIAVTANARAIRHFLTVRGSILGDDEMRLVSAALLNSVRVDAPAIFADFSVQDMKDGLPIVKRSYS
ncbi:FAD-dependent thymidylate synthase [Streptomyces violaceus]